MRLNRFFLLVLCFLGAQSALLAQGTLRGKVSDDIGSPIPFASVYVKQNTSIGTTTDFDGDYSLVIPDDQTYIVVFSFAGLQQQNLEVTLKDGEVFVLNVSMKDLTTELEAAEVVVKANRGGEYYLEEMKANSAESIDYISFATLKKTGDSNVPDAVKRVSGVSTVGGYVSVRGLVDRYIKTTLNGSRLPTLDPFTNNIKMDLFPTGLIDNVIITKTMNPDLPGDWSGAYISIETKDYPEDLQISVSTTFGFNAQSTFQDIVSAEGSSTDWLGFDNGFRDIPEGTPTVQSDFPRPIINPTLYQQFSFLGIAEDLYAYGITNNTPISNGSIQHQVGLNQLGFLGAGNFNNESAVQDAIQAYQNTYSNGYFFTGLNQEVANLSQGFNDSWWNTRKTAPLNFSQNFSIGNQTKFLKRDLGYVFGFRYSKSVRYDGESVLQRTNLPAETQDNGGLANIDDFDQEVSRETAGWSALLNLSYKLNKNNRISLLFMPNFRGQNNARSYTGRREDIAEISFGDDNLYEERQQLVYQLETEHYLPKTEMKVSVNMSYTDGQRNVLDFKDLRYLYDPVVEDFLFNSTFRPDRRYRYMFEDLFDSRVAAEIPILKKRDRATKLIFGGAYQYNTRENQQVVYTLQGINEEDLLGGFDQVFDNDRFSIVDSTAFDLYYTNTSTFDDSDLGFKTVVAGFAKFDYHLNALWRFVGGVRMEHTDILVDIKELYENNYPIDAPERFNGNGQNLNPGEIRQVNFLPSLNVIYKIADDDAKQINLRLNYSKSLARPGFREMSALSQFDYELRARVRGNTDLKMTDINNYDFRLESYFKGGRNLSVSFFYKDFKNHIELIQAEGGEFTWQNAGVSEIFGLEIEGKTNITKNLELRANATFIDSRTTVTFPIEETRSMFGQAPYILNGMLSYSADSLGLTVSASYNVQGPKLAVVANTGVAAPDVFELPTHLIDLKIDKKIGKHWGASLAIRNLLNAPFVRRYKFDEGFLVDFDRFRFGTLYNLSISYKL